MSESQEWDDLEEFLAERLIPLPAPADARWSDCMRRIEVYARQQVEEAYREGSYQGKMRFTQMKVREAVEAFRERAAQLCDGQETGEGVDTGRIWRNTIRVQLAAAIRQMIP